MTLQHPEREIERETEASARANDLSSKSPQQIGGMMRALTIFIRDWTAVVADAEERVQRDRQLLMDAMAELTRLSHHVARTAADVLEATTSHKGASE